METHESPGLLFFSRTINMHINGKKGDLQWSKESESSKASALSFYFQCYNLVLLVSSSMQLDTWIIFFRIINTSFNERKVNTVKNKTNSNKTRRVYVIRSERWDWNDEECDYVDGAFDETENSVETLEEAEEIINEFNKKYPKSKKQNIGYDKTDPWAGIVEQRLIFARCANLVDEKTGEKYQIAMDVFRVDYEF